MFRKVQIHPTFNWIFHLRLRFVPFSFVTGGAGEISNVAHGRYLKFLHICHLSPTSIFRPATGVLSNIDHQKNPRKSTKYRPYSTLSTKYRPQKLLKKRVFTRFATKVRMFIRAGLYPTSQEIHVKQGAGSYFHITSFNGRVIQFRVPRFIIFRIIGKIYQHSKRF